MRSTRESVYATVSLVDSQPSLLIFIHSIADKECSRTLKGYEENVVLRRAKREGAHLALLFWGDGNFVPLHAHYFSP